MGKRKVSLADGQRIAALARQGWTIAEIGEEFPMLSAPTIRAYMPVSTGLARGRRVSVADRQEMRELDRGGMSLVQIAEEFGVHLETVRGYVGRHREI